MTQEKLTVRALRSLEDEQDKHEEDKDAHGEDLDTSTVHLRRKRKHRFSSLIEPPANALVLGTILIPQEEDPTEVALDLANHLAELELEVPVIVTPIDADECEGLAPGAEEMFPAVTLYMEEDKVHRPVKTIEAASKFIRENYPIAHVAKVEASLFRVAYIKKIGPKKWRIYSEKGKNLGDFSSLEKAKKHLSEIEFFKHKKG